MDNIDNIDNIENINNERMIRIAQNKQNPIYQKKYTYSPTQEDLMKYGLLLPSINMIKRHVGIIKKYDKDVLRKLLNEFINELD